MTKIRIIKRVSGVLSASINVPGRVFNQSESEIADGLFCAIDKQTKIYIYLIRLRGKYSKQNMKQSQ